MSQKIDDLFATDPEFMDRFEAFAASEVVNEPQQQLDETTRYLVILASLLGCQGVDEYRRMLPLALKDALTPVMAKEIVYQAVPYLGIARVRPFLIATNEIMQEAGVGLPLEGQATTTMEDRLQRGAQAQVDIFGPAMKEFWKGGHINRWLASKCFGDYYTRGGLDLKQRELITFCFLVALGGCEPQLVSHAAGNISLGNDRALLTRVVSQCLPYIGYPRSLNAFSVINKAPGP
jgi:4-carboxymuconolactone decarboxylase